MRHNKFNWYERDGQQVFGQVWRPDVFDVEGVISIIHDLGEHSSRYERMASFFVHHGYAVMAFDLRGHGQSAGTRGHCPSYDFLLGQIDRILEESSKRFPGEAKIVFGQGLGGNLVLNHTLTHNPRILGVIANSPWLRLPNPPSSKLLWQARIMNYIFGYYTQKSPYPLNQRSNNAQILSSIKDDPLLHDKISIRLNLFANLHGEYALKEAIHLNIPTLLMHGTANGCTSFVASQEFAKKAPADYMDFKPWEGLLHELHNEPQGEQVLQYMLKWMTAKIASAKGLGGYA
ncbi:MAG: alpha/beta fold hydrolase [Chitinophagales bacterium]